MYAVGVINLGQLGMHIPCGNHGLQKLHNKTERGWKRETETMHKCVDRVYVVSDFTQKMCEMNNGKLVDTVERTGKRIW